MAHVLLASCSISHSMNHRHVSHLHEPRHEDIILKGVRKAAGVLVKCLQEVKWLPAIA